jgi:hypothetical protein
LRVFGDADDTHRPQEEIMKIVRLLATLALPVVLAACGAAGGPAATDPGTDPIGGEQVTISFAVGAASVASSSVAASSIDTVPVSDSLVLSGSNGTLELTTIAFIVEEIEFDCDDDRSAPCADFEEPPAFVDLPLGSGSVDVTSRTIPAGTYDELEFEIDDLDVDDDDSASERDHAESLLADIRLRFPAFPYDASMVVEGVFTPIGGAPQPFLVYFEADIEVEIDLVPPLTIDADGNGDRSLVVDVFPSLWFVQGDGSVLDLSQFDGDLVEFELEIEIDDGSFEIEFEFD